MRFLETLFLSISLCVGMAAQTITTFAVNPKDGATPLGINDNGDVVGYYVSNGVYGFLRSGSTGVIKHLGIGVWPVAVNDSDEIVGWYRISAFYWPFGGKLTQFLRGTEPAATAVNTAGYVAGAYRTNYQYNTFSAFLMNPQGEISTIFTPSTGSVTSLPAMNNLNQVVGCWETGQGIQGYVYTNGTVNSDFVYPNAVATCPTAINDAGEIAGYWTDSAGVWHGFVWNQKLGFTSFDAPSAIHTVPLAINNSGTVVGGFATKKQTAGGAFLYSAGSLTVISIPHAKSAQAVGINSQGLIVGSFTAGSETRGFLYQP